MAKVKKVEIEEDVEFAPVKPERVIRASGYLEGDGVSPHAAHADHKHKAGTGGRPQLEDPLPKDAEARDVVFDKGGVYYFDGKEFVMIANISKGSRPEIDEKLPEVGEKGKVYFVREGVFFFDGEKYVYIASQTRPKIF